MILITFLNHNIINYNTYHIAELKIKIDNFLIFLNIQLKHNKHKYKQTITIKT
jgi:hypothetical protein